MWPCFFFESDTSGEKPFEEFFTGSESLDMQLYASIGIIKNGKLSVTKNLEAFEKNIYEIRNSSQWSKSDIIENIEIIVDGFVHDKVSKSLDQKM